MSRLFLAVFFALSALFLGLLPHQTHAQSATQENFQVFLLGDAGKAIDPPHKAALKALEKRLDTAGPNSAVVFLGDNIYPKGLPPQGHKDRPEAERRLEAQFQILEGYPGRIIFMPGNHDWRKGKKRGDRYILRQERYVNQRLREKGLIAKDESAFLPGDACPGPVEVPLKEDLTLLIVDTKWWLHRWDRPHYHKQCDLETPLSFLTKLEDALQRNRQKRVLVATHHPVYTYGKHNGDITWVDHIFPLQNFVKGLWLPLPGLGSLYPLYRKTLGNIEDLHHPRYQRMRKRMAEIFRQYPNTIHAAGHEHNLQYIYRDSTHYLVSGAGSKKTHVRDSKHNQLRDSGRGFMEVDFLPQGRTRLKVVKAWAGGDSLLFNQELFRKPYVPLDTIKSQKDYSNQTHHGPITRRYLAGNTHRFFFGKNYRKTWAAPIEVPVFDIGTAKGGLDIIRTGGGQQTKSLKLRAPDGKKYSLRTIDKFSEGFLMEELEGTLANDVAQDQISASNPYGAFVVPMLQKKLGIYYTHPKMVYVPDDPRLGLHRETFAGRYCMLEEHHDGEVWEDADYFGNPEEIIGTDNVVEELDEDNDNAFDLAYLLKARLFDMWIGDWDRHEGQWRWSIRDTGKGLSMKPIPEDRDEVFFVNEGLLPKIASRKWIMPKFQGFDYQMRNVNTFNHNARHFDRTFLVEAEEEDWVAAADTLQKVMSDSLIEAAMHQLPDTVFNLRGPEIVAKLKARREDLKQWARTYYRFLAKNVKVVGSEDHEYFDVNRLNDDSTEVKVWITNKEGTEREKVMYHRIFKTEETHSINLYGRDDEDYFDVRGIVSKGPIVRIIGGEDDDYITDESRVKNLRKNTYVYDLKKNTDLVGSRDTRNKLDDDPEVNRYNRKSFKYDLLAPLASARFNTDDGVFVGLGGYFKNHGFRKTPYKMRHKLLAFTAFGTNSFAFEYEGDFTQLFGEWGIGLEGQAQAPQFTNFFFGLGNETEDLNEEVPDDFYRVRQNSLKGSVFLQRHFGQGGKIQVGPTYHNVKISRDENRDRFVGQNAENLVIADDSGPFAEKNYLGLKTRLDIDRRDRQVMPSSGSRLRLNFEGWRGLDPESADFSKLTGSFSFYVPFRLPSKVVWASRVGFGHIWDDYEFFQANTLGNRQNLRGYRVMRFAGRSSAYANTELRAKLFRFNNYLLPVNVGVLGFTDAGRVWVDGQNSNDIQLGYGGGIYLEFLDKFILNNTIAVSDERVAYLFRTGFLF